ncbi:hypothetical protein PHMEG_00010781 [Phytophthora megakarya]|uniref:Chromo domain-containing protein n=1 Tax=Phytophthora megakarya TaxID=4795 RepID=A0A225WFA9_9STRA|nr:hypothetical protein PHMEG_00010781 [Phytophthora megakarya]
MSKVFARFRDLLKSKHCATLGYRPQANGQQECSVQNVKRSVRANVAEVDRNDWDEHAERLMFALNTSFDAARLDTPFYLVHGWDAQGTISAMLGPKPSTVQERTALEWRRKMQRDYSSCMHRRLAKESEACEICSTNPELSDRVKAGFEAGHSAWLYILKYRTRLGRKLADLWHGPFRIDKIHDDFRVKLKIPDTGYRVNPWVHTSRLKPRALFPKRPTSEIQDSWEPDTAQDEYEFEEILDLRWIKRTWTSNRSREYLVKWKGCTDPEWIPLVQFNCGALLYEFDQGAKARARFQAMQSGDDHPGN